MVRLRLDARLSQYVGESSLITATFDEDVQLAVLGNADAEDADGLLWVERLTELSREFPVRVSFYDGYDQNLSHLIYAAADAFFVPRGALLLETIHRAQTVFHHREERWDEMVRSGLELDLSWRVPARTYRKLYEEAVLRRMRSFLHQPVPRPEVESVAED